MIRQLAPQPASRDAATRQHNLVQRVVFQPDRYDLLVVGGHVALELADEALRLGARVAVALESGATAGGGNDSAAARRAMIRLGEKGYQHARDFFECWSADQRGASTTGGWQVPQRVREQALVVEGHAVFTGRESCAVHGREVKFDKAIVAPASVPRVPAVPGLDEVGYLTDETWHLLSAIPQRIAVLGAGPEACELAQALARTGAEAHLITCGACLLPGFDRAAVELVERSLLRDGVRVHRDADCTTAETVCRMKALTVCGEQRYKVFVDEIIVAAGTTAATDRMGLAIAGVRTEQGAIRTDAQLRTDNVRVFAIDIARLDDGSTTDVAAACVRNALLTGGIRLSDRLSAPCVMTQPQIAVVGKAAKADEVETYGATAADIDRAHTVDGEFLAQIAVHATSGRILGATLVGDRAAELMLTLTLAMQRRLSLRSLAELTVPDSVGARVLQHLGRTYLAGRTPAPVSAPRWPWQSKTA